MNRAGAGGGWPATFEDVAAGIDLLATRPADSSRVVAVDWAEVIAALPGLLAA
jgi:hypothetical protein